MRKNIIGLNIKRARKEAHITQMELAARLQVMGAAIERSAIAKIETGRRPISDIEIAAIAKILNVEIAWLFKDSETLLNKLRE
jgi:transcriptional regulator with XRE-family HTH domain